MVFGPLSISLAPYVRSSKTLSKWVTPIANWYAQAARYRQFGFKYDDLLMEENPSVQRALGRLTDRQTYDRAYRLKRASQCSVLHAELPKDQWTKPEEDVRYLAPHVKNVVAEETERKKWDNVIVKRK
ncbi:ubiquinol-cytochrome-c reductase complex subunit 6 [Coprinopsis cinerea okayama7|uniref:Cytochrome b-c1 complex subunit 7 n=1 Tax=Coprinopsis cinerea (strain Okayama-7 / 130 / ATCC MYA-4618 / FGSC 9003) TaxID=240176 RepID=A8NGZ7_COPC7|nr:ubiquinol-cytochrome-c reductase complex subunit 6 [Coprinopsis cinerea okayama7\|eukprot:XP_001833639.1 ubiquinol-cytochrome-c reductase complex subunit 6 [Coprinopsis cinerea okayama7\